MADRRFSHLERDRVDDETPAGARPRVERTIERDDELQLDESGARTHFCRACEAENEHTQSSCFNCGAALDGPGQAAFDEVKLRELAALRDENRRALARARAVEQARKHVQAERVAEREPAAPATAPPQTAPLGLDPAVALAIVVVCLFATVSATLHLFLSAIWAEVPWSVLAEVAIATILTWVAFTVLQGGGGSD